MSDARATAALLADAERAWLDRAMTEHFSAAAHVAFIMGLWLHIGCLVIEPIVTPDSFRAILWKVHAFFVAVIVSWLFVHRRLNIRFESGVAVFLVVNQAIFAWMMHHYAFVRAELQGAMLGSTAYLLIGNFALLLAPVAGWRVFAFAALQVGMAAVAMRNGDAGTTRWVFIVAASAGLATIVKSGMTQQARRVGEQTLKFRRGLAPLAAIVEAGSGELEAAFKPRVRRCVCLSSDWRSFQAIASAMPSDELAAVLAAYYRAAEDSLKAAAPDGRYLFDWIADELFVVFYADDEEQEARLVDRAIAFARRLLLAKAAFYERHRLPRGIDVGLAVGDCLVGMMGPPGFRKASALGECADDARRMQAAAKDLRKEHGERDRIVFDERAYREIRSLPAGVMDEVAEAAELLYSYVPAA